MTNIISMRGRDGQARECHRTNEKSSSKYLGVLVCVTFGMIVTIDDDNYLAQENYIESHSHVGKNGAFNAISSEVLCIIR